MEVARNSYLAGLWVSLYIVLMALGVSAEKVLGISKIGKKAYKILQQKKHFLESFKVTIKIRMNTYLSFLLE